MNENENLENNETVEAQSSTNEFENTEKVEFEQQAEPKQKKFSYKKSIAVGLVGTVLCGASLGYSLGVGLNTSNTILSSINHVVNGSFSFDKIDSNDDSAAPVSTNTTAEAQNISKTVGSVENSVVNVNIKATTQDMFNQTVDATGSGSGIIYSQDDNKVYILTNNHVVAEATSCTISITGKEQVKASLVGRDSANEIAVISVAKSDLKEAGIDSVTTANLADSDKIEVGETVIAIGNALGQGKTATVGIVSASNKTLNLDGTKYNVIQTDAAINPGNSGGALVNSQGEVIGINTAKTSQTSVEGVGYAIPINKAKEIAKELMDKGTVEKPYLGISGYSITDDFKRMYNIDINGVFVGSIDSDSPAEKAGLQQTDIITSIDGEDTATIDALSEAIGKHKVGDEVTLGVVRDGTQKGTVKVTLGDSNKQF